MAKWEYATVEWYWTVSIDNILAYFPNNGSKKTAGSDNEIVNFLNDLGNEGWEIIAKTSGETASGQNRGPWVYWTLKRAI